MSTLKTNKAQLGQSGTATQNFTITAEAADGTMKLARGNAGATTQDILTVDASGLVTLSQGKQLTLGTAQNTTSGTAIDFTGIPSWVKRITVVLNGVSVNGTSNVLVRLGTSGGIETTGYAANLTGISAGSTTGTGGSDATGFLCVVGGTGTNLFTGLITLINISGNLWVGSTSLAATNSTFTAAGAGTKTLASTLDRVRITSSNGTDVFDAGSVNILYEG